MDYPYLLNIVRGRSLRSDFSNIIENFSSPNIPETGSEIVTEKAGRVIIKEKLIDYRQIQCSKEEDRGGVIVYIFI